MRAAARAKKAPAPRRRSRKRLRPFGLLIRTAAIFSLLFILWVAYLLGRIEWYKPAPLEERYEVGIVLGAALWRNVPSPGLRERLDHAVELYKAGQFDYWILTGGVAYPGALSEAEGMRNYLMDAGIPEEKLLLEPHAQSTYDNLLNSQLIMEEHGFSRAIIITHDFHTARAADIASFLGYDKPGFSKAASHIVPPQQKHTREVMAFTKWKIDRFLLQYGMRLPDNKELGL